MIAALLGSLAGKLATMGVAAKAGIGLGIAATATAGVAVVLPPAADNAGDTAAVVTADVQIPTLPSLPVDVTLPEHAGFGLGVATDATSGGASAGAQFGLDIASRAPAAGNVPTSLPPQAQGNARANGSGQPEATGLDRARQTPAGQHIPEFVPGPPAGPPAGTPAGPPTGTPTGGASAGADVGLGIAGNTPAAGRIPSSAGR